MTPAIALLALLAAPVAAPGEASEPEPAEQASPLVAAGWCTEKRGDSPGCDAGLGVALARRHRLAWVAVIGGSTVGTGIAWTANPDRREGAPLIAVAAGVVARYDSSGVDVSEVYPAIGATLRFGGGVR